MNYYAMLYGKGTLYLSYELQLAIM